jgi:hypothetical protein
MKKIFLIRLIVVFCVSILVFLGLYNAGSKRRTNGDITAL